MATGGQTLEREGSQAHNDTSSELWYCHSCEKHVTPNLTEYSCTLCDSGCIEAVKNDQTNESSQPMEFDALNPNPLSGADNFYYDASGASNSAGGRAPRVSRRPRHTRIAIHRIHGGNAAQGPNNQFQSFLNNFVQSLMGGFNQIDIQMPPIVMAANAGDYVFTSGGLDNIITMLMNQIDGSGPPPASKAQIEELPTDKISQQQVDNNLQCHVCMEDYSLDEEVRCLPCKHVYHPECIVPWLEMHGTCPICRKVIHPSLSSQADGSPSEEEPRDDNNQEPYLSYFS